MLKSGTESLAEPEVCAVCVRRYGSIAWMQCRLELETAIVELFARLANVSAQKFVILREVWNVGWA